MDDTEIINKLGRLYEVTPDMFKMGIHHLLADASAKRFKGMNKVADVCCGSGMMTVSLANFVDKVVAVDINEDHIKLLEKNIEIAGVEGKVDTVTGDILDDQVLEKINGVNAIYSDPEWGVVAGDGYSTHVRDIKDTRPPADVLLEKFFTITDNVAIRLTKELDLNSLKDLPAHEVEKTYLDGTLKFYTIYFGDLVQVEGISTLNVETR